MPFKKGQSGNPKGRPPKGKTLSDILQSNLDKNDVSLGYTTIKRKEALIEKIVQLALQGDLGAIKYVFDRLEGKPRESGDLNLSGSINLPPIQIVPYDEEYDTDQNPNA